MERSRKSNKVTWASGTKLCQVQLFRRNDHPSQVVYQPRNRNHQGLKKGASSSSQGMQCDSIIPPGFENRHYVSKLKEDATHIIKWKCPPKFILNSNWLVASGEESEERELQKRREMTVVKRLDPYPSAIPPCSISLDKENEPYDDSQTPIVPLIPIEDTEYMEIENQSSALLAQTNVAVNLQTQTQTATHTSGFNAGIKQQSLEANITIDASLAFSALTKVKEVEHSIDKDLLIKILCDRNMVEKLINDDVAAAKKLIIGDNATAKHKSVDVSSTHTSVCAPKSESESAQMVSHMVAANGVAPNIILSQPVPVSFPCTKPVVSTHLTSNVAYCASNNVQPKVTTKPSLPTIPIPELPRADSSFTFLPVLKPNTVLPPTPPPRMPNPMQVGLSFMPPRPNSFSNIRSVHPNSISNFQPAHLNPISNSLPTQPNIVSNHRSAHTNPIQSSRPVHPNAVSNHHSPSPHSNPGLNFQHAQPNPLTNSNSNPISLHAHPNGVSKHHSPRSNPGLKFQPAQRNPLTNSNPIPSSLSVHSNVVSKHHSPLSNPGLKFQPAQPNPLTNSQPNAQKSVQNVQPAMSNTVPNLRPVQPNHISNIRPSQPPRGPPFPPHPIHCPSFQLPQPLPAFASQPTCNTLLRPSNSFPVPTTVDGEKPSKDNYLKNLIKEHGGMRQGVISDQNISNAGNFNDYNPNTNRSQKLTPEVELKKKFPKYCVYFKTPKGCRNGPYCRYRHDLPSSS